LPLLAPDIVADDRRRRARPSIRAICRDHVHRYPQSTALVEKLLPYDVIFLLNHFFEAVGRSRRGRRRTQPPRRRHDGNLRHGLRAARGLPASAAAWGPFIIGSAR
jgi:hypothetical protein